MFQGSLYPIQCIAILSALVVGFYSQREWWSLVKWLYLSVICGWNPIVGPFKRNVFHKVLLVSALYKMKFGTFVKFDSGPFWEWRGKKLKFGKVSYTTLNTRLLFKTPQVKLIRQKCNWCDLIKIKCQILQTFTFLTSNPSHTPLKTTTSLLKFPLIDLFTKLKFMHKFLFR